MNTSTQPNLLLVAALEYAHRGWRVFPCHSWDGEKCTCGNRACASPAKHPRTSDGFKSASKDPVAIRGWWAAWPNANVGLRTGNGLVVLDVDEGRDGNETLEQLMALNGKLPETLTVQTGGGGFHYYFSGAMRSGVDVLGRGVDIRGEGGYVIAPPSNHASGRQYLVEASSTESIAPLPAWVEKSHKSKPVFHESADVYISGGRNVRLHADAGYLRRRGFGFDEMFAILSVTNRTRCQPPLDEQEVRTTVRSACRYAPNEVPKHFATGDESTDWKTGLIAREKRNGDWEYVACVANAMLILEHDPVWRDALFWDEFHEQVMATSLPWRSAGVWQAEDTTKLRAWLHRREIDRESWCIDMSERETEAAMVAVAKQRTVHPVREWLRTLEWDGTKRVEMMLTRYFGAEDHPYTRGVSLRWAISAVARAMRPGCKVDTTLILEGNQGAGKSSALRALAGDQWFFDSKLKIGDKDAYQAERGRWIIELAELDAINKSDIDSLKQYLTEQAPTYRGSYERQTLSHPRSCVFVGTTNRDEYLGDVTGNRRFWPVKCSGRVDVDGITRDRDQIWAEALSLYEAGVAWWVDSSEFAALCSESQDRRMQVDVWESIVRDWLRGKTETTVGAVLTGPLGIEPGRITVGDQVRAGRTLCRLGWTRRQVRDGIVRIWKYMSPVTTHSGVCHNGGGDNSAA